MSIPHHKTHRHSVQLHWIHWCVVIGSLFMTVLAWSISTKAVEEKTASLFNKEAMQIIELIQERMQHYEDALWAGVATIHSHNLEMNYPTWKQWTRTLNLEERYPGINGIGVIYYVPPDKLDQYLAAERQFRPNFNIHPQHNKEEYWPITYIEPLSTNLAAVGLDMAHEVNRYTAAMSARDTGKARITGSITLVQDQAKTPGFLFYVPFYRNTDLHHTHERREHFIGLVYAPFIMSKLMNGTLAEHKRGIAIKIRDEDRLLYDEHNAEDIRYDSDPLRSKQITLEVYGRSWTFDLRSTLNFREATSSHQPTLILVLGITIDLLLLGLFLSQTHVNKVTSKILGDVQKAHQTYIDSSGDGYWDWYLQEDYEYMSPRFWEIFGYRPEEKPHKPSAWQDMIFKEDLAIALENLNKHSQSFGKHPYEQEVRYRHKNGSTVTVMCRGRVIAWDDHGQPLRMVGTHTDITQFKSVEKQLRQALDFEKLLVNVSTDYIFVKDQDFRIVKANPAFLNLYPKAQQSKVIGYTTVESYDPDQANQFLAEDKKAFQEGVSEVIETIDLPDGTQRTLFTKKIRFEDKNNQAFILGFARDITQLKNTETALIKANTELEEFAYRTSHDLRSPLISSTKLLSITRNTLEKGDIEKALYYIDIIQGSLKKLEQLVSDILNMTKSEHSDEPAIPINIQALVEDSLQNMSHMEGYERLQFSYDYQYSKDIVLKKEHITLVIENLLSNAIKYQDPKNQNPTIHIATIQVNNQWHFHITDNGLGIPEKAQDKMFSMFKRFHPNTAYGSGLGLYMIKKSVTKMGGTIHYTQTAEGSRFTVSLPIAS